jgi:hypothetical protein
MIPDCVLDFLEDFNSLAPLAEEKAKKSLKKDFFDKQKEIIIKNLVKMRELGALDAVEGKPLPRQYPGAFMVKLTFERGVRGLGFVVTQGTALTGQINSIVFQEDGFSEDYLKERLTSQYKK